MLIEVTELSEDDSPGGAPKRAIQVTDSPADPPTPVAAAAPAEPAAEAATSTAPKKPHAKTAKPVKAAKSVTITEISSDEPADQGAQANIAVTKPAAKQPGKAPAKKAATPAKPAVKKTTKPMAADIQATAPQPAQTAPAAQPSQAPQPQPQLIQTRPATQAAARKVIGTIAAEAASEEAQPTAPAANVAPTAPAETEAEHTPFAALEALSAANPLKQPIPKTITPAKQPAIAGAGLSEKLSHNWQHTRKRRVFAVLIALFVVYNLAILGLYHNRTYPGTSIDGQVVGARSAGDLAATISKLPLMPKDITLHYNSTHHTVDPSSLGMHIDPDQTAHALVANRSWLPLWNQLRAPRGTTVINVDPKPYQTAIQKIGQQYRTKSVDARIELSGGNFKLVPQIDAQEIDSAGSQAAIVEALSAGRTDAQLQLHSAPPKVTNASLQPALQKLQAQRNTNITLAAATGNKSKQFSADQIGTWFVPNGLNKFKLDDKRVADAVTDGSLELSVTPDDTNGIADLVTKSVEATQSRRINVTGRAIGQRTFSFCAQARGEPQSEVKELGRKAEETLNDKRGWSLGGNITFKLSTTDCNFTIWLTDPQQMSSFGDICDSMWSCEVTPNVVINHDRWTKTTEPWLKVFGSGQLQLYRSMAINHEVGHWLGFGHSSCPAPGQPAPVMEQQSINLQGCVFNAWPTATERLALKNYLNL